MKLTNEQVKMFQEEGVLVAENMVTEEDMAPVIKEYEAWIDQRAHQLAEQGVIQDHHKDASFEKRIGLLYAQSPEIANGMDIMQLRGAALFAFLRNDHLLDAVESLIGPEITCNPIQHIRAKPPASSSSAASYNIPWHQDAGVTWAEADDSDIITCWLALVDATVENGCMEVLPGVWKQGFLEHKSEGGTSIRPELFPQVSARPVPVRKGGMVFMHRYTPHRSTPNKTDDVRWSLDLRYQPTGQPTGRPFHPAFVARSKKDPASVLTDHAVWSKLWEDALQNSKGVAAHRPAQKK